LVVGKSDAQAGEPAERPVTIEDLGATVYHALGIDAHKEYRTNGRPVRINKDGAVVKELFG
jgi:arylsulfatase A-like enzyme